ncbi:hypothetical protein PWT90_04494 [Aphanocladium album]|nr:hypothetical protein PWT90_04494 [Aphanocladium album]
MDVYPVHLLDNAENFRKAFVAYLFVFNDVLDAKKLADSLSDLLQTGDWKKLSGRLRKNKQGTLELHVPQQFTSAEPVIGFSHKVFDCDAEKHPLGRTLPDLSGHVAAQALSPELLSFTGIPAIPRSIEDLMKRGGGPQLYLHVTEFANATVVSLTWPHYLMDAVGLQGLLRNWSLIVNDRAAQVLPLVGARTDLLRNAVDTDTRPKEALILEKLSLKPLAVLMLGLRILWACLWGRKWEQQLITLTQDQLNQLCQRARSDISKDGNLNAFISEGDILTAWAVRMLAGSQPNGPVTVASIINARGKLSALNTHTKGYYVQNLLTVAYMCFEAGCDSEPLGRTALNCRRQLAEQCTEPQILSHFRMQLAHIATKGRQRMLFGAPGSSILAVNNLSKINTFHDVDFAGAVVHRGEPVPASAAAEPNRHNPPGTPVYYHPMSVHKQASHLNFFRILGRDHKGSLLLEGVFRPETWARIVKDLEELGDERITHVKENAVISTMEQRHLHSS